MARSSINRFPGIDVMRGVTLFLMLFVNDLYIPGVPGWMVHTQADYDGMGLADWVFPGFLFMVGLSVPFAVNARKAKGDTPLQLVGHILFRSLSLIVIGVLIFNGSRINPELTGMPELLWRSLVYISVFLIWNVYPRKSRFKMLFLALQLLGVAGLLYLSFIFKAGTPDNETWLETGWWGILGLIGWGYLTAALVYVVGSGKLIPAIAAWILFVLLNMLTQSNVFQLNDNVEKIFGIVLRGNIPSITTFGMVVGIIVREKAGNASKLIKQLLLMGVACILAGFILHQWYIISKIHGTPSWAMLCNGISLLLFAYIYYLLDVKGRTGWSRLFDMAGKNSLTTYLAPDLVYFMCWGWNIPLFFYKQAGNMWLTVSGSLVWAVVMVLFANTLSRFHIRLKL